MLESRQAPVQLPSCIKSKAELFYSRPVNPALPVVVNGWPGAENRGSCSKVECPENPHYLLESKEVCEGARSVL